MQAYPEIETRAVERSMDHEIEIVCRSRETEARNVASKLETLLLVR